jgi:hypothetical protein
VIIDWMIRLPTAVEAAFRDDLYAFEESKQMSYMTSAERAGIEKGLKQGLEQGLHTRASSPRADPETAANIRERFLAFCEEMDMAASYKPILLRCLLDTVDADGSVAINWLTPAVRDLYLERKAAGRPVERPRVRMAHVDELTDTDIRQLILAMPFKKFAQCGFLKYDQGASGLRFAP